MHKSSDDYNSIIIIIIIIIIIVIRMLFVLERELGTEFNVCVAPHSCLGMVIVSQTWRANPECFVALCQRSTQEDNSRNITRETSLHNEL